jgi:hypothetical protein
MASTVAAAAGLERCGGSDVFMENPMDYVMDVAFLGLIVVFFAVSAGLVRFCAALRGRGGRS